MKKIYRLILLAIIIGSFLVPISTFTPTYAASLTLYVSASSDDCKGYWDGSAWVMASLDDTRFDAAGYWSATEYKMGAAARWQNVTIPQGATITSAHVTLTSMGSSSSTSVLAYITGNKESNAATFSNLADWQSRRGTTMGGANDNKRTTAQVSWSFGAWANNGAYDSPDISTVIQEIVDQDGWSSGNAIALFIDDFDDRTPHSTQCKWAKSYDGTIIQSERPTLYIEYTSTTAPTVTTQAASDVSYTTATGNGNITNTGGKNCSTRGICYSSVNNPPTTADSKVEETGGSFSTGAFNEELTSLSPGVLYRARAYAINSKGISYGDTVSFTTLTYGAPTLTTQAASGVGDTTATLNGNITATGGLNATVRGFEYGQTSGALDQDTHTDGDYSTGAFTANIGSLSPSTTYFFRSYATSPNGTGYGPELSFTTAADSMPNPDSPPTIGTVIVYEDILETGDAGVLLDFNVPYANTPPCTITEAYRVSFCDTDGVTELKTTVPYTLLNEGYPDGVVWIYFTAAEVTADSISYANMAQYRVVIYGNPVLGWVPGPNPVTFDTIDEWHTSGTASLLIALDVIGYAEGFKKEWSLDMVRSTPMGNKLTIYGEEYFENVINGARTVCPNAFYNDTTSPIKEEDNTETKFGATLTNGTGTATGSPITLVSGANTVEVTVAGTFTLELEHGTVGTAVSDTGTVTGSPVTLVEGTNTITVPGGGTGDITVNVRLYNTQVQIEDTITGTGFDLTEVATRFGMSRGVFSGMIWFLVSIIICAAAYNRVGGKTTMLLFNMCIICGGVLGLMPLLVTIIMFIGFGALTGYVLFFRNSSA